MKASKKGGLADLKTLRKAAQEDPAKATPSRSSTDRPPGSKRRAATLAARRRPPANARSVDSDRTAESSTAGGIARPDTPDLLSADDKQLFRQAVKWVHPLKDRRIALLPPHPPESREILVQRREAALGGPSACALPATSDVYRPAALEDDGRHYLAPGHGPDVLKNLKRNKWPIEATIDLHGATLDEARARLDPFVVSCLEHGIKCVRIVHGKGYGSKDGTPVLRDAIRRWLTQLGCVMAYTECSEANGGSGAVQVLLK